MTVQSVRQCSRPTRATVFLYAEHLERKTAACNSVAADAAIAAVMVVLVVAVPSTPVCTVPRENMCVYLINRRGATKEEVAAAAVAAPAV